MEAVRDEVARFGRVRGRDLDVWERGRGGPGIGPGRGAGREPGRGRGGRERGRPGPAPPRGGPAVPQNVAYVAYVERAGQGRFREREGRLRVSAGHRGCGRLPAERGTPCDLRVPLMPHSGAVRGVRNVAWAASGRSAGRRRARPGRSWTRARARGRAGLAAVRRTRRTRTPDVQTPGRIPVINRPLTIPGPG